jgi:hypothetical protein
MAKVVPAQMVKRYRRSKTASSPDCTRVSRIGGSPSTSTRTNRSP